MGDLMATQAAVVGTTAGVVAASGTQFNEDKLIRAGQKGDQQAVDLLFERYHRPLFQTALRVLGNAEDAEDALQDGLQDAAAWGLGAGRLTGWGHVVVGDHVLNN